MVEKKTKALLYFPIPKKQWAVPETIVNQLKKEFSDVEFVFAENEDVFKNNLTDAQIIFSPIFEDAWFNSAQNLKWFHSSSIQFTTTPLTPLFNSDVIVTNSRGAYQTAVSERAIGASFYFLHGLISAKNYTDINVPSKSFDGLTVGVFGLGENGTAVGLRANLLGAKVVAVKRSVGETPEFAEWIKSPKDLLNLTSESDIIVITSPLTRETEGLFSAEVFESCKNGAVIINLGRPAIVDENSVLSVLEKGKIAGYAVDSLIGLNSKLLNQNNVLIIPHISPSHKNFWNGSFNIFSDNLDRFLNNQSMRNVFNKELLY